MDRSFCSDPYWNVSDLLCSQTFVIFRLILYAKERYFNINHEIRKHLWKMKLFENVFFRKYWLFKGLYGSLTFQKLIFGWHQRLKFRAHSRSAEVKWAEVKIYEVKIEYMTCLYHKKRSFRGHLRPSKVKALEKGQNIS